MGLRECFVPREGFLFCSVDMDTFELRTWAQCCVWAVGESELARVLNADGDPHAELGARLEKITSEEAAAIMRGERGSERKAAFKSGGRQTAKPANFGFPGGMGPEKFRTVARKGTPPVILSIDEARELRRAWAEQWPEAIPYFAWVKNLIGSDFGSQGFVRQFGSMRIRGPVGFTEASNGFFQGLAADAIKDAGFALAREMYADPRSPLYGSRIVNFPHDEYITEVPIDRAHEAAERQAQIQREVCQRWIPDVKITCAPALMRRWSKGAETVRDASGRLIPWEPK